MKQIYGYQQFTECSEVLHPRSFLVPNMAIQVLHFTNIYDMYNTKVDWRPVIYIKQPLPSCRFAIFLAIIGIKKRNYIKKKTFSFDFEWNFTWRTDMTKFAISIVEIKVDGFCVKTKRYWMQNEYLMFYYMKDQLKVFDILHNSFTIIWNEWILTTTTTERRNM